jgi:L-arabinonolactonase
MLELMLDVENQLGECVLWCERTQRVLWTDILGARLYAHHPASGSTRNWPMPEALASFALTADDDRLLLGLASRLATFALSTGAIDTICEVEAGLTTRLNDGRCDRQGRFVFGTFNQVEPRERIGGFYRLSGKQLERLPLPACAIANSICFSPDGATMYYANSPDRAIRCCDYDIDSGAISHDRIFVSLDGDAGEPDGSCIDAEGCLWNAQWGAARIVRYTPAGVLERMIDCPALQPSCVALGGPELNILYATSARIGLSEPAVHDGAIFRLPIPGLRGLPESRYLF